MFGTTQKVLGRISQQPINDRLISYVALRASRIIVCEPLPSTPEVPISKAHGENLSIVEDDACNHDDSELPGLKNFLATLINDCEVDTYLILIVLVYLSRLRATLTSAERGLPCTPHRIILASLIHAAHHVGYYRTRDRLRNICLGEYSARPLVRFSQEDVISMEEDLDARLHGDFTTSDGILLRKMKEFDERNNEQTGSGYKRKKRRSISAPRRTVRRVKGLLVVKRRGSAHQKSKPGQHLKPQPLRQCPNSRSQSKSLALQAKV